VADPVEVVALNYTDGPTASAFVGFDPEIVELNVAER
jgi:hypothetical protein